MPIILIWFFKGFYFEKSLMSIVGRSLLIIVLTILFVILLMVIVMIIGAIFATMKGPEAMEYIKPK